MNTSPDWLLYGMLKMFVPHEFHRTTGCLLFEDGDNGGITAIVAGIEDLYNTWSSKISKADFWALAANAAIIEATPDGTPPHRLEI